MDGIVFQTSIYWLIISTLQVSKCRGEDSLKFLAIADWGGTGISPYTTEIQKRVAQQMALLALREKISFIISLGDHFYPSGVKCATDSRFEETFEKVYHYDTLSIPWYLVAGNHDYAGNVKAQIDYSSYSDRWTFPDYYYKITKSIQGGKTLDIILLDTVILCGVIWDEHQSGPKNIEDSEKEWAWLEEELKSSTADYLLVGGHYPVHSTGWNGPTHMLVRRLEPLLYKYKVSAYISGHEHNLQHIQMEKDGKVINYFITGASSTVSDMYNHWHTIPFYSLKYHFARTDLGGFTYFEVSDSVMKVKFINGKGFVTYEYDLQPRS